MPASERAPQARASAARGPQALGDHPLLVTAALVAVHAILFVAAFAPLDLWPLAAAAPAPLALAASRARSARTLAAIVLLVQIGAWLLLQGWMARVTAFGYPLVALYLAMWAVAFAAIMRGLLRRPGVPAVALVPVVWVGLECLRGEFLFDGYPWFLLGHPAIEAPVLVQSADLFGAYFSSFLAAAAAGAIVDLVRWRRGDLPRRAAIAGTAAVLVAHGANVAYGVHRLRETPAAPAALRILVVQTNLPQSNKVAWTPEAQVRDVTAFAALTRRAAAAEGPAKIDLIVWPETMLPVRGLEPPTLATAAKYGSTNDAAFAEVVRGLADELDAPMLVGSLCHEDLGVDEATRMWTWTHYYNSAYVVSAAAPLQRYDKRHLTPFGEVMPYISRWTWLERRLLALGAPGMSFALEPGTGPMLMRVPGPAGDVQLGTPICFEDAVARACRRIVHAGGRKQADLLVNLSNDGWFGGADAARAQHVQAARFRAIENRVPIVRCANTGMSVAIDSAGRVVGAIGDGRYGEGRREGWLLAAPVADPRTTLSGRIGEAWGWTCAAATALLVAWRWAAARRAGAARGGPAA